MNGNERGHGGVGLNVTSSASSQVVESRRRTHLRLYWKPDRQEFHFGSEVFLNEGPTKTEPSHDLAHLLIAANGGLLWFPRGTNKDWRLAEYNAVFLEHLLHNVYVSVLCSRRDQQDPLDLTLQYARRFVEQHYAPFPLLAEEAYRSLCAKIDRGVLVALCPYYYHLHYNELHEPSVKVSGVELGFWTDDEPSTYGKIG